MADLSANIQGTGKELFVDNLAFATMGTPSAPAHGVGT